MKRSLNKISIMVLTLALCVSFNIGAIAYANQPISTSTSESQTDFSSYMIDLRSKIQRNWNPPEYMEQDGHALLNFSINRVGEIRSCEIIESSGNPVFDESTLEALKKSAPFARFPVNSPNGSITIQYSFDTAVVDTGDMKKYLHIAERYQHEHNNQLALAYMDKAINEVSGDTNAYFLYGKRSRIKQALGDVEGAKMDMNEAKRLKAKFDKKRILASRIVAEMEQSPYSYFSLAHSYEIAEDYQNAIVAIDKAIELTNLNNGYKRYKAELLQKGNIEK